MTARDDLAAFIARFSPEVAATAGKAIAKLRKLLPGAVEMVYDNYNALVIGFGATDRASEAILSIALYPKWVNLFFLQGASLPDPHKLLAGKGRQVRSIRLVDVALLNDPNVRRLIELAIAQSAEPFKASQKRRLLIKSVSARQRPRQ